jgi:ubiquinone/menaquinone biosynthesis C-methylase UbiE
MGRGFLQTVDALLSRRRVQLLLKPCKTLPQSLLSASAAVFLNRCAASFAKRPLPLESVRAISGMIGAAGLQASRSAMSFYRDRVYPHIVAAMGNPEPIQKIRQQVVPHAQGIVLEIGVGPGVNFPLYDPAKVKKLYALEPNRGMVQRADIQGRRTKLDLEFLDLPGEKIPLPDASVDTVVSTFTLCTIPGVADAIRGIARVLRPGGQFLFFEHGLSPDISVRRWQQRTEPLFQWAFEGCHVTRNIPEIVQQGGFRIERMDTGYMAGFPKCGSYCFWGAATPQT